MSNALAKFFQFVCLDPRIEFIRITLPFHQRDSFIWIPPNVFLDSKHNLVGFQQLLFVTGSPIKSAKW